MSQISPHPDQLPNDKRLAWYEWLNARPDCIKAMVEKLPPWNLYRLKTSGHRVTIRSYSEDGTLSVDVTGKYNAVLFERNVFGVHADDLEECDLPGAGEAVGVVAPDDPRLTDEQRAILSRVAHVRMTQPGEN